jgi:hypothetical protein
MKWTALFAASAITVASLAGAAPARDKSTIEKSPDLLQPQQLKKPVARVAAPLALAPSLVTAAAAPTVEDVGDPDSFGRNVTYLGLAQTTVVTLTDDCTGSDPTIERCIVNQPAPLSTNFNETDLATMNLPAKATKSLVCFAITHRAVHGIGADHHRQCRARRSDVDRSRDRAAIRRIAHAEPFDLAQLPQHPARRVRE